MTGCIFVNHILQPPYRLVQQEFGDRGAAVDHGVNHLVNVQHAVDDSSVAGVQSGLKSGLKFRLIGGAVAGDAIGFCQLDKVRTAVQGGLSVTLVVDQMAATDAPCPGNRY